MALIVATALISGTPGTTVHVSAEALSPEAWNSQTIPILRGSINPRGDIGAFGGGDITIVGDALLAQAGPSGTLADIESHQPKHGQISIYVVREGDTLSQIAEMFDVSVNTIRWANDINKDTAIQEGNTLVILPVTGVRHTIVAGDTLKSIAKKYGGDIDEILNYNGIDRETELITGNIVVVPNGELAQPKTAQRSSTPRSSTPTYAGYYMRPIAGGARSQGLHGFNAVDLDTYTGAEIYAAAAGDVIISRSSGWNGGYGNYVVIRHDNGTQTLYAHMSSTNVGAGQHVGQGQVVGYVGSTGRSTGSHLHFEVRGATNPF